jgi:hypothetical protein
MLSSGSFDREALNYDNRAERQNGWPWDLGCLLSAAAGALVSFIFRSRLSWLTLVWTVFLTLALGTAAYLLRVPTPIPPEHWQESEGGGPPMQWDLFSNSFSFN